MSATNSITADKLFRLIGTPNCPAIIDVRPDGAELLPTSVSRRAEDVREWAGSLAGKNVVVSCIHGHERSAGVAAILRTEGINAEILEGGFEAWRDAGLPVIVAAKLPERDPAGRTLWVTRARPKVDRIACPWLIRRFVDPEAVFLFVSPTDVAGVAERFGATPFDVEGVFWSHRGDQCTFDTMIEEFGLDRIDALARLAIIVRGADTARPEIAPQAAGLLAASLGLSRMFSDDLEQLEAGMPVYDAFYRWCRDAVEETHDWISHKPKRSRQPVIA
ncbi:sulfurtransferase/chromate resistance protein [Sphingomonas sp. RB56-2]|uniref:Sulfurtransferase/chromate resistance protein n=1 Tax=Sphingomonas brevis TaxID=2908206 RepID=A0ABT0S8Z6_9SPHN|nr:sulfurtransferase/chromate resistance protein [Sphingomonas brevis]MCL6740890.1 sulfurtransferase/chromate resistance protein [Sphingomonas brevis]